MKRKLLFIVAILCANVFIFAQYSSGTPMAVGSIGMTVKLQTTPTLAKLTLTGPSNSFLGIGGGDSGMLSGADGFIYNSSSNTDYTFGGIGVTPTADAIQDWTITSNTVAASIRTIVATRTLAGSSGDVAIPNAAGLLDFFCSHGNATLILSYHGAANRDYVTLNMAFDPSLAAGETDLSEKRSIYPNPTSGIIFLKGFENLKNILLYDSSGRKVLTPKIENNQIDISKLKSGTYFLEIEKSDAKKVFEKILKK